MYEWRTGRSCVYKNNVHLVFITKYRRGVITRPILDRLVEVFTETCEQMDSELLECNGEDDHVHLLVCAHPKTAIANLVGKLKGKSSYVLRKEFWPAISEKLWGNHFWSPSYCVVSEGGASLDTVKAYIEKQREPPTQRQINHSKRLTGKKRKPA
jgi:putative transposase